MLVIFPVVCIKRVRNDITTQPRWQLYVYQDIGRVLSLQSLSTRWFSRHAVILATQGGMLEIIYSLTII